MKYLNNKIIFSIIICEATGMLSSFLFKDYMYPWFDTLNKPSWNPPSFIFAPVWIFLYLLMGLSLGMVWESKALKNLKAMAISLFGLQLVLNFFWSIFFFRFHSPAIALIDIILMIIALLFTVISFSKISKTAAWLLVPYMAWICFAAVLNYSIWIRNT